MGYRYQIDQAPQTMQDLVLAAERRFWEGSELLSRGENAGGIYLLGYVAEMLLKHACFRFEGVRPYEPIVPRLHPVRTWARAHLHLIEPQSYHSLLFWVHVLRTKRRLVGRSLSVLLDARLVQRVRRLHGSWCVDIRYCAIEPDRIEAANVYNDVVWLRDHHRALGA